jgi:signal transduction histidine kinase
MPLLTSLSFMVLLFVSTIRYIRTLLWLLIPILLLQLVLFIDALFGLALFSSFWTEQDFIINGSLILLTCCAFLLHDELFHNIVAGITFLVYMISGACLLEIFHTIQADSSLFLSQELVVHLIEHWFLMLLASVLIVRMLYQFAGRMSVGRRFKSKVSMRLTEVLFSLPLIGVLYVAISFFLGFDNPNFYAYGVAPIFATGPFFAAWIYFNEQKKCSIELDHVAQNIEKERERLLSFSRLQQSESKLRKEIAQITSHHLRGPSSAMLKLSEDLNQEDLGPEELKFYHKELLKNAKQNIQTIDDLAFLFNTLRRSDFNLSVIDVEREIKVAFNTQKKDHKIEADLKLDLDFGTINYSLDHFRGLLRIVLSNCFQFASTRRKLTVAVRYTRTLDSSLLVFEDNGIGFDSEKEGDKIFSYGYKLNPKSDHRGAGLFLAKGFLELLGDEIELISKEDVGTTVILKFRNA